MSGLLPIRLPALRSVAWLTLAVVGACGSEEREAGTNGVITNGDAGGGTAGAGSGSAADAGSLDGGDPIGDPSVGMPCPFPQSPTPTGPWLHVVAGRLEHCEGADGPALGARFCGISGLELVGETLYVAETNRVRALDLASGTLSTVTADPLPTSFLRPDFTDLASDEAGNLYVNDSPSSLIYQLDPATGEMVAVVDMAPYFDASTGVGAHPNAIISDRQGGLWVADFNSNTLRHVNLTGGEAELVLTTPVQTMVVDSDGELYFTSNSIIQWLDQRGPSPVPLFGTEQQFGEGATRFGGIAAATLDPDGLMWVSAWDTLGGVRGLHVAGNVRTAERVDFEVPLEQGSQLSPVIDSTSDIVNTSDIVLDTNGDLLVGTETQIHRVDPVSGNTTTLAGSGCVPQLPKGNDDGVGPEASFDAPWDLATDGEIAYVMDFANRVLRRIDLSSNEVTTFAGKPGEEGVSDGIGSAARFGNSFSVALADDGNLYVMGHDGVVRRVDPDTAEVTTIAGAPMVTTASVDGVGAEARIATVGTMTADGNGHLYFAEHGLEGNEYRLRRVTLATGEVSTVTGLVDADDMPVEFYEISALASDGQGNLFIGDFGALRRLALADGVVTDLVDGHADASFASIDDLAYDGSGALYAATFNVVRRIDLDTLEMTVEVGTADLTEVRPGPLPAALFNPRGLAVLPSGDLLITDSAADVILRADFDGPN